MNEEFLKNFCAEKLRVDVPETCRVVSDTCVRVGASYVLGCLIKFFPSFPFILFCFLVFFLFDFVVPEGNVWHSLVLGSLTFDIGLLFLQTGLEKSLFGNHPVSFPGPDSRSPPPAFASDPLMHADAGGMSSSVGIDMASITTSAKPSSLDIIEINGPDSATSSLPNHELNLSKNSSPSVVSSYLFPI